MLRMEQNKEVSMKHWNKPAAFILAAAMAMTAFSLQTFAQEGTAENEGTANICKIDETEYATLQDAVDAAGNDPVTITLLKDAAGNGVKIESGKKITIDFNQFTYEIDGTLVGSAGTETQAFQLLRDAEVTFKNGTITSEKAYMLVQNYSNLTLEHMTLDGQNLIGNAPYTLSNNFGKAMIKDTEITAKDGGFAFDLYYWPNKGYGDGIEVSVSGNSNIKGNIEYGSDGSEAGKQIAEKAALYITGGTFSGEIKLGQLGDDQAAGIDISGGTFDILPAKEFLHDGFHINADGSIVENGSEEAAAKEALNAEITKAEGYLTNGKTYTEASKQALLTAIDRAKTLAAKADATMEELTNASSALTAAVGALQEESKPTVDPKADLNKKIAAAEAYLTDGKIYTEESINVLCQAIDQAKIIASKSDASEAEIGAAKDALDQAVAGLREDRVILIDEDELVRIYANADVLDSNTKVVVRAVTEKNVNAKVLAALKSLKGDYVAYDIQLMRADTYVQPNGKVRVTARFATEALTKTAGKLGILRVYHISEDGKITSVPATISGGIYECSITIETDHFSKYVLVNEAEKADQPSIAPQQPDEQEGVIKNTAGYDNRIALLVLAGCAAAWVCADTKKRNA